ncbi:MAG TPA: hypothetical protein VN688_02575 [Gemmataceae bacterium]|nr:hypothetical protein [Gemmataceae bacterium]
MQYAKCPTCGHETTSDAACPDCTHVNGSAKAVRREPPPPEVANWVIEPVPPEIAEHFQRTFNEEEYLAEVRKLERTGGVDIAEMLAEIERIAHGKE